MKITPNPLCQRDGGRDEYRPGCYGTTPFFASLKCFRQYEFLRKAFEQWRLEQARYFEQTRGIKPRNRAKERAIVAR